MPTQTGFRDNSVLITTANVVNVEANNASDTYEAAASGPTQFVVATGATGIDTLLNFDANDTIINGSKIFDGNKDGFVQFGANGLLDIDRTTKNNPGEDQITVAGVNEDVTELRYLGEKGGNHVYAMSSTLKDLFADFGGRANVLEGTVNNDTIDFAGQKTLLVDNALGLNLGSDKLTNFGSDDLLVTTRALWDSDSNQTVSFGKNLVLDVSGAAGPLKTDPMTGPGGQIDFNDGAMQSIGFLGMKEINGVEYYFYGTADTTVNPFMGI
ncbi:hypothetical protein DMC47_20420 [Nostoc sp. 3335mG]|nr:hypothetical protein DMC47_20420 [Nostoc sp. 3335mG]